MGQQPWGAQAPRSLLTAPQPACGDPWHSWKAVGWMAGSLTRKPRFRSLQLSLPCPQSPTLKNKGDMEALSKALPAHSERTEQDKGPGQLPQLSAHECLLLLRRKHHLLWAWCLSCLTSSALSLSQPSWPFLPLEAPASSLQVWSKPWLCHLLAERSWAHDFSTLNLNFLRKMGKGYLGGWVPEMMWQRL